MLSPGAVTYFARGDIDPRTERGAFRKLPDGFAQNDHDPTAGPLTATRAAGSASFWMEGAPLAWRSGTARHQYAAHRCTADVPI